MSAPVGGSTPGGNPESVVPADDALLTPTSCTGANVAFQSTTSSASIPESSPRWTSEGYRWICP